MHSTTGSYDSGMVEETCHTFDMIFCSNFMKDSYLLLQLEGSGNWPMDEVAVEKTKFAFLLQIGERWVRVGFYINHRVLLFIYSFIIF